MCAGPTFLRSALVSSMESTPSPTTTTWSLSAPAIATESTPHMAASAIALDRHLSQLICTLITIEGICEGKSLAKLIMFNNGFTGGIPSGLTACASLVRVRMQSNRLTGTIPVGFGKLPSLQRLELAGNDLSARSPATSLLDPVEPLRHPDLAELLGVGQHHLRRAP
nr:unnamed protein product [Digitaria exilis]